MSTPDPPTGDPSLRVYSDFVCPFCYLGRASLSIYRDGTEDPPPVDWRPFDLRGHKRGPDREIRDDIDDGKDEAYFERVRRNVERLSERYDVAIDLALARDIDSWNAQQAALYVRREYGEEAFVAFHDAVFDALWEDGRDIGDPAVLGTIAADLDLPADAVQAATRDGDLAAALEAEFRDAREAGVSAVPTFVYDGHAARGAVPPAQIERLVEAD